MPPSPAPCLLLCQRPLTRLTTPASGPGPAVSVKTTSDAREERRSQRASRAIRPCSRSSRLLGHSNRLPSVRFYVSAPQPMSRSASLATELPSLAVPASLPVSALLPWQYQPSFLAGISVPSLAVPTSFATSSFLSSTQSFPHEPPLCSTSLHPHPPVATVYGTTPSTGMQGRRSETRRAATSRSSSSKKREAADRKGAAMHGVCCGTLGLRVCGRGALITMTLAPLGR